MSDDGGYKDFLQQQEASALVAVAIKLYDENERVRKDYQEQLKINAQMLHENRCHEVENERLRVAAEKHGVPIEVFNDAERWRRLKASAIHSPKTPLEYAIANVEYFFEVKKDDHTGFRHD